MRINDPENYKNVKESISMTNLKRIIDLKNISIIKLATNAKVSGSTINAYINGQKIPSLPTLISIADYLNCNIDYLLDRTNTINKVNELQNMDHNMNLLLYNIEKLSNKEKELVNAYIKGIIDNR